jgi:hypothetical protein
MNDKIESSTIISNEALRGKPFLDIDRVITESKSGSSTYHREDQAGYEGDKNL